MARRTYRRSVSYSELSTKQLNALAGQDQYIAQFSGLNTGKNYTTIDQTSFANVKNMYVDIDERLSTRPPLKTSEDSKYSSLHIISYKAINGVHFFVVNDGGTKLVSDLGYSDSLITLGNISTSGKLFFVNSKYVVFDTDSIWGFSIDYAKKSYTKYTEADLIYIPTSYDLNPRNDKEIAKNIFTPNTFEQIVYTAANVSGEVNPPDDGRFVNKNVVVNMNGKSYNKRWTSNQWRTFVYTLYSGEVLSKCTNIEFSRNGKYVIAFTPKNMDDKTFTEGFYFSENGGKNFTLIPNPCNNTDLGRTIAISEDNEGILYVGYNGEKSENKADVYVAYAEFPTDGVNFSWSVYNDNPPMQTFFNAFTRNTNYSGEYQYCYAYQNYEPNVPNIIAHCVNSSNFVICFGQDEGDNFYMTTNYTNEPSATSGSDVSYGYHKLLPIVIHAYLKSKWQYACHFARNTWYDAETDVHSAYIPPDKARVRMVTDGNGNAVIDIGYFTHGGYGYYTDDLRTELVQVVVTKDEGFTPGIFEGTAFEKEPGKIGNSYFCGLVTSLASVPESSSKRESEIIDNNWMDVIGTLSEGRYDKLRLDTSSELDYGVDTITTYENYNTDHKNVVDLSKTTEVKRRSEYNRLSDAHENGQYMQYIVRPNSNTAVISLGGVLSQTAVMSSLAGFLGKSGSIDLFESNVRPLYVDANGNFVYLYDGALYKNGIEDDEEVTVTIDDGTVSYNYLIPDFVNEIVTNNFTFVFGDSIYQSYYGDGKLYVPEYTKDTIEGEITNVIRFSDISLGIFLENAVYEYKYDSDITSSTSIPSFTRHATKLQLGCLKGSDIVHTYDGASIVMTTKRGVAVLNYQQFVQSTEQVYTFLSNNIDDYYEEWSGKYSKPIKITLFKDYILFYQTDNPIILVFDTRNQSWWPWELPATFKIIADIDNNLSLVAESSSVTGLKEFFLEDKESYKDYDDSLIRWIFETQPMHFQAPNYYKHISRLSIVTTDEPNKIAFDVRFTIYKNLNNMSEFETVFNKMEMLTTIIKRINFLKLNALKVTCSSNDEYTKNQFITSALIIHYRPTEVIR